MTISSVQKVIKVGSSLAVTIPARDARSLNIHAGSEVDITLKPVARESKKTELLIDYEKFKKQYGQTLKNLSQR